jgi:hypothetical protein
MQHIACVKLRKDLNSPFIFPPNLSNRFLLTTMAIATFPSMILSPFLSSKPPAMSQRNTTTLQMVFGLGHLSAMFARPRASAVIFTVPLRVWSLFILFVCLTGYVGYAELGRNGKVHHQNFII